MGAPVVSVRAYEAARDERWAEELLDREMGGRRQARRGEVHDVLACEGLVGERDGAARGLLTYRFDGRRSCELCVLAVGERRQGIGTALLDALVRVAGARGIWLVTTNDNLDALRFYQRRGFRLRAVRPGAVDEARARLKPQIGAVGEYGIPLRDEIELERPVGVT